MLFDCLEKYLCSEEFDMNVVERSFINEGDESLVVFVCFVFFLWIEFDGNYENLLIMLLLYDIDLEVKKGVFVVVVGIVGFGKSFLLVCMFGEMLKF